MGFSAPPDVPPKWVCQAIERIHPLARIGWGGGPNFDIVELWRVREAPETLFGVSTYWGHVYGSRYDLLMRVPLPIMEATVWQVFDGTVIDMVKHAAGNFATRQRQRRESEAAALDSEIEAISNEWADNYWYELQRGNIRDPIVPKKFITPEEKAIASGDWYAQNSFAATAHERVAAPGSRSVK